MSRVNAEAFRSLNDKRVIEQGLRALAGASDAPAALVDRLRQEADEWSASNRRADRQLTRAWLTLTPATVDFLGLVLYEDEAEWVRRLAALIELAPELLAGLLPPDSDKRVILNDLHLVAVSDNYDLETGDSPAAWRSKSALIAAAPDRIGALGRVSEWLVGSRLGPWPTFVSSEITASEVRGNHSDNGAKASTPVANSSLSSIPTSELLAQLATAKERLYNLRFESATGQASSSQPVRSAKSEIKKLFAEIRRREKPAATAARGDARRVGKTTTRSEDRLVVANPDGGWDVVREGGTRASAHFGTQEEAVARAREIVRKSGRGHGDVRIQPAKAKVGDKLPVRRETT